MANLILFNKDEGDQVQIPDGFWEITYQRVSSITCPPISPINLLCLLYNCNDQYKLVFVTIAFPMLNKGNEWMQCNVIHKRLILSNLRAVYPRN